LNFNKMIKLLGGLIILVGMLGVFLAFKPAERARFILTKLEIRLAPEETYSVPANLETFRKLQGYTPDYLRHLYLESCRSLGIKPFEFEKEADVFRELLRMHFIWLGVNPSPGYQEAKIEFFRSVEAQLSDNPEVLKKFLSLFKTKQGYLTTIGEFAEAFLAKKEKKVDLGELAKIIAALKNYSQRFSNSIYLKKEEWSSPRYLFYQLDFYKKRSSQRLEAIKAELARVNPKLVDQLEVVLTAYEEGARWLEKASLFFLEESWFFDEEAQAYRSLRDYLKRFWEPVLGGLPEIKPGILRFGEIDGTSSGYVPYLEYPGLLKPLNNAAEIFLRKTSPAEINQLLEGLGEVWFKGDEIGLPAKATTWPLNRFIYSLSAWEERMARFTEAYDLGCPLTMLVANIPHEVAHSFHFRGKHYWKEEYSDGEMVHYQCLSNYLDEGVAELCQWLSVEPVLKKYPLLWYENLLKHYIFLTKSKGNSHTWGLLWMLTALDALGGDWPKLFFLATRPGFCFQDFINSTALQTEKVLHVSSDTQAVLLQGEARRRKTPEKYIFPAVILELSEGGFKIVSLYQ